MNVYEKIDWVAVGYPNMVAWLNGVQSNDWTKQNQYWDLLENLVIRNNVSFENTDRGYGLEDILSNNVHSLLAPILIGFLHQKDVSLLSNSMQLLMLMAEFVTYHDGTDDDKTKAWKIHDTIWGGLAEYIRLLKHHASSVRISAINLLRLYPEHLAMLNPILLNVLEADTDDTTRAYCCWAIHFLNSNNGYDSFIMLLEQYVYDDEMPLLQKSSAMCLVDILEADAPSKALDIASDLHENLTVYNFSMLPPHYGEIHRIAKKINLAT